MKVNDDLGTEEVCFVQLAFALLGSARASTMAEQLQVSPNYLGNISNILKHKNLCFVREAKREETQKPDGTKSLVCYIKIFMQYLC